MENMKMTRNGAELKVTPGLKLTSAEASGSRKRWRMT